MHQINFKNNVPFPPSKLKLYGLCVMSLSLNYGEIKSRCGIRRKYNTVQPQHFRQDDLNNDIISQPLSVFIFGVFTVDKGREF
jgi:hypothetical protein